MEVEEEQDTGAIIVRDESGTVAILPRVRGTDQRTESAFRAERSKMVQFQAILDSIDITISTCGRAGRRKRR